MILSEVIGVFVLKTIVQKYNSFVRINENDKEFNVQFGDSNDAYNFQLELIMSYHVYGDLESFDNESQPDSRSVINYFVVLEKDDVIPIIPNTIGTI